MKKRTAVLTVFPFLLLTLFFGPGGSCSGADIDIQVVESGKLEVLPGDTSTISLRLINTTQKSLTLKETLTLPKGINNITPFSQLSFGPGENVVVLVSLHISRDTEAGIYSLNYIVKNGEIEAEKEISLHVLAQPGLELLLGGVPSHVLAGEDYLVEFFLQNTGNTKLRSRLHVSDNLEYSIDLETEDHILEPGATETVIVSVKTEEEINQQLTHRLKLMVEATTEDDRVITETASAFVGLLPRVTGDPDPYHRLPVTLGANLSYREDLGVQFVLAATGPLDVEGDRWVDALIRPPGLAITGDEFSEKFPEYRFSYWDDSRRIDLGDHRFSLSDLTESRFSGRGISVSTKEIENFELAAYYRWDRDFKFEGGGGAVRADYYLDEKELGGPIQDTKLWAGYLNLAKEDERAQVLALGGGFTAEKQHEFELEYAKGLGEFTGQAFSGNVDGNHQRLSYRASYLRADPDFPGEKTDRESYNVRLKYGFVPGFSLAGSYGHKRDNLDLNPNREALKEDRIQIEGSLSYKFTRFDLSRSQTWRVDRQDDPNFNWERVTWEGVLRQSVDDVDFRASYRRTWVDDLLKNTEETYDRFRVRVQYTPANWHTYRADYSLRINREETRHWGSVSASYDIEEGLNLDLGYSRWYEKDDDENEASIRDSFTARISKEWSEQNAEFSMRGRYTRRGDEKNEFSVRFEYSQGIASAFAVDRRPVGKLAGRIYDAEASDEPGFKDVIVRVNGVIAVTDEDGYYTFPDLEPGSYHLQVDRSTLEPGHIVDEDMPLFFSIEAEEEKTIDFGVVKGSTISGQAVVYAPVRSNNANNNNQQSGAEDSNFIILNQGVEMEPDYGLSGLLLILRNNDNGKTKLELTGSEGEFKFSSLRPGSWELIVSDNGTLPRHHELEKATFILEIEPGDEKDDLEIRILPSERRIEFIDEGESLP